jgi:oligoribonuclease (3'-5' exoribonuclease)
VLGFSLEDIVNKILADKQSEMSQKEPDAETLNFITAGMDDYEKFLAQNKAKDDLEFLGKSI